MRKNGLKQKNALGIYKYWHILMLLIGVLFVLTAVPLPAAENAKIKLPDGMYMYDSSTGRLVDGNERIGFGKYFVVKNNAIYIFQDAMKKMGVSKLNKLCADGKKYKILFGGVKVGEIRIQKIDADGYQHQEREIYIKNFKEGPAYRVEGIYVESLGSAARHLAVPEEYKIPRTIFFNKISKQEVDTISNIVKEKLLPLVKNRKELTKYKLNEMELDGEGLELLDKISYGNNEMYIGIYWYGFKNDKNSHRVQIVFSVKEKEVYDITSNYDNDILSAGGMEIYGMLDVDGCGKEELIIEKIYGGLYESFKDLDIYKQKTGENWKLINKNRWKEAL